MADAFIIQSADATAGIVVLERGGVRFFASEPAYSSLDGRTFKNVNAAKRAVDGLDTDRPKRTERFFGSHARR
ncbi:MAG TPA: hypothetical protein VM689_26940 [Aliidongia sp.]|nr:hypothetical protein [Aliidongia sp.]